MAANKPTNKSAATATTIATAIATKVTTVPNAHSQRNLYEEKMIATDDASCLVTSG